uniref:Uncharacterized protein n=1 Tax=Anguilla anguilla TaxID=7936 RepID=A0A0E9XRU3_ANGAN
MTMWTLFTLCIRSFCPWYFDVFTRGACGMFYCITALFIF